MDNTTFRRTRLRAPDTLDAAFDETNDESGAVAEIATPSTRITTPLPEGLVLVERAVALLRRYLTERGLGKYRIFHCPRGDAHDLDVHLGILDEGAHWEPHAPAISGGEPLSVLTRDGQSDRFWPAGTLHLKRHEAVFARWYWVEHRGTFRTLRLCATPSIEQYTRLRARLEELRHGKGASVWQIIRGSPWADGESVPRDKAAGKNLLLSTAIRHRIDIDVIRFFDEEVVRLYRSLGVSHRRGVLLHGPPGNGKTSTIRYVGAELPKVPAMILRPGAAFDSDDFEEVLNRWRAQAPAILIIEDLNWLLGSVNVSTFLNLLDGIESSSTDGLLLIATTNYPEKLDPAINNRPGRFDVVIELPCPDEGLRREFFRRNIPAQPAEVIEKLTELSAGLSFSHLQEILRLSGLLAIQDGRSDRTDEGLMRAAQTVRETHEDAERGFAPKPEMPFGLAALRAAH